MRLKKSMAAILAAVLVTNSVTVMASDVVFDDAPVSENSGDDIFSSGDVSFGMEDVEEETVFDAGDEEEEVLFGTGEAEEETLFQDEESEEEAVEEEGVEAGVLLGAGSSEGLSVYGSSGVSYNLNYQNYQTWTTPMYSYLEAEGNGYLRVEYSGSKVLIERYDASLNLQSQSYLTGELPYFGGFYAGSDAYYLVFGQENKSSDDSVEVIRVVKYDKNWNRLGSASLYGENTTIPFDAGCLRAAEYGGYLYIRTSHEMYSGHQANLTMQIRTSDMSIVYSFTGVWQISAGYVSHSFNQFILVDDEANIVAADHGDAYPRSIVIGTYTNKAGVDNFISSIFSGFTSQNVLSFNYVGITNGNYTGASLGGFEYSDSSYLTAGNSVVQDDNWLSYSVRNIFVTSTLRSDSSTTMNWITNYPEGGTISASTPQLVKLSSNSFLLLWAQMENNSANGKISYVYLDGQGNPVSSVYTGEGYLSDCHPTVSDGTAIWYVTDGTKLTFYQVKSDGTLVEEPGHIHSYEPEMKFAKSEVTCGLVDGSVQNQLTTNSDGKITYSSSNKSVATVNASGKVTLKKTGTCTITASAAAGVDYAAKKVSYTLKVLDLKNQTIKVSDTIEKTFGDDDFSLGASCNGGVKLSYSSNNKNVAKISSSGKVTIVGWGTAVITVKAPMTSEYTAASAKVTITVKQKSISNAKIIFTKIGSIPSENYMDYVAVVDENEKLLREDIDFNFWSGSHSDRDGYVSWAYQYILSTENTSGANSMSLYPINEKPTLDSAVRNTSSVTLTWEQEYSCLGYVIYRKVNDGSYTKAATIKDSSVVTWTDTKATNKNSSYKYYIKAYTKNQDGYVYSKSSNAKTVNALSTPSMTFEKETLNCGLIQESALNPLTTNTDGKITYKSSDTSVATVDSTGKVTLKKLGTCTITASAAMSQKYAAKKVSYTLNVLSLKKQTIKVTGSYTKTYGDKSFSLGASCSGGAELSYTSSNKEVATVSGKGVVTVKGSGTAVITVTAYATSTYAGTSTEVTVTVNPKSISGCRLIFTKTGSISSVSSEFEKYVAVADGSTVLTEETDYRFWANSWYTSGSSLASLSGVVTGMGNYTGSVYLTTSPISEKPVLSKAVRSSSGITLTWEQESSALGYVVYRKVDNGNYTLAATIKDYETVSWKDTEAVNGESVYKYYIKAYTMNQGTRVYTTYSNVKTLNALTAPSMKFAQTTLNCGLIQESVTNKLTTNTDGKITYTSSDTSVATVSSTGKVTLKKVGKCTITASAAMSQKYSAKKVSYTLNVLSLKQQTIKVTASYTKTYGAKSFSLGASCSGGAKLSYASSNKKVVTVSENGTVTIVGAGTASITVSAAATSSYIAASTKVTVKVNPKSISGCKLIFTKTGNISSEASVFKKYLAVVDGNTVLKAGTDYSLRTDMWGSTGDYLSSVSCTVSGMGNYTGEMTSEISPVTKTTVLNSATLTSKGVQLSWKKESGALGYEIYRKQGSGSYSLVKTITSRDTVKWTDTEIVTPKAVYTYYVRAYTRNESKTVYASRSAAKSVLPVLDKPVISKIAKSGTGLKLTIKKVTGATGYVIQRYNGKKWVKVATTTQLTYTDTTASSAGTTYKYRVRAYCTAGGKTGYSEYSAAKSAKR